MLKQILSKLPRKSSKPDSAGKSSESPRSSTPRSQSNSRAGSSGGSGLENSKLGGSNSGSSGRSNSTKRMSSAVFPASMVAGIEPLVPFKDVPGAEKMNLFISKVSLCCVTFDFTNTNKNTVEKDVKRQTLLELVEFVASKPTKFSEPAILAMCRMCAVNLFRDLPPSYRSSGGGENEDDEPLFDPAWPHLQLVYELLLKFVISSSLEAKVAKKYIDHSFILRLLELFDSDDPRERDCLKTILHRVYGKFMVHRPFVRKSLNNMFYRFVFESERHNGIAELLEIYGSIISGFALPLKEEHKMFLRRVLIPLHKPRSLAVYFQQLTYCISQFIEKEPKLVSVVINGVLRSWPITNSQKEVMLLGELEELLESATMLEFQKIMVPLCWRIGSCINSLHFQVAERALFYWNNDHIVNLIAHNRQELLPILVPVLEKNAQTHWNPAVLNLTLNVRKIFIEMDDELFSSCYAQHKEEEAASKLASEQRKEAWDQLETTAAGLHPIIGNAVLVTSISC